MIEFQILCGKQAGLVLQARRFPVRVGRAAGNDLCLNDDGVWDEHFQITSDPETGFTLATQSGALVNVNQTPAQTVRLRNGDLITAGAAKLAFRLSETRQSSLRLREWFVWAMIVGISVGQLALIGWLLR